MNRESQTELYKERGGQREVEETHRETVEGLETDNERGEQIQTEIYKESVKTERDKERKRDRDGGGLRDRQRER